jgi:8-oxo-dGTP diphosphatase
MKNKDSVIIHVRHLDGQLLLVLKDRPLWQKGRLNLVGGKVEKGETPVQTAIRELHEETGMIGDRIIPDLCGAIKGDDFVVWCFVVDVSDKTIKPRKEETEKVDWYCLDVFDDPRLMPNLKIIIPLLQMGLKGWVIEDQNIFSKIHEFVISFDVEDNKVKD